MVAQVVVVVEVVPVQVHNQADSEFSQTYQASLALLVTDLEAEIIQTLPLTQAQAAAVQEQLVVKPQILMLVVMAVLVQHLQYQARL